MCIPIAFAVLLAADWQPVWVALAGGAGVAATGLASWLLARRRESGSVRTSDAATLWNAYDRIMDRLTSEVEQLRERIAVLEAENAEYRHCRERVAVLEAEVARLRGQVDDL